MVFQRVPLEQQQVSLGRFDAVANLEHFTVTNPMNSKQHVAMDQPIQDFSDCHVGIVNMLDDLTALSRQRDPDSQRREMAGRIQEFFRDVVLVALKAL